MGLLPTGSFQLIPAEGYQGPRLKQTFVLLVVVSPWKDIRIDNRKVETDGNFSIGFDDAFEASKGSSIVISYVNLSKRMANLPGKIFLLAMRANNPGSVGHPYSPGSQLEGVESRHGKVNFTAKWHGNANSGFFFPTTPQFPCRRSDSLPKTDLDCGPACKYVQGLSYWALGWVCCVAVKIDQSTFNLVDKATLSSPYTWKELQKCADEGLSPTEHPVLFEIDCRKHMYLKTDKKHGRTGRKYEEMEHLQTRHKHA